MHLHVLPERSADAATNMAMDFLLLQRYPTRDVVARFRHYGWGRPAFTFGYSQKIAFVRARLPQEKGLDLTRRPTGGGLVDHRDDWTYALVLPRRHPLWERPGPVVYRAVHEALADALGASGAAAVRLQDAPPSEPTSVCFEQAELGDVVRADDGRKVAGAALKRNKHGVLLQGSVWRPAIPEITAWDLLSENFADELCRRLTLTAEAPGWPAFDPDEEQALIDQYASPEWIELR